MDAQIISVYIELLRKQSILSYLQIYVFVVEYNYSTSPYVGKMTSLIFIHGTGVTQSMYTKTFVQIKQLLAAESPYTNVYPCFWGDQGVKKERGLSIPKRLQKPDVTVEDKQILAWADLHLNRLFESKLLWLLEPSQDAEPEEDAVTKLQRLLGKLQLKPEEQDKLAKERNAEVFIKAVRTVIDNKVYNKASETVSNLSSRYYDTVGRAQELGNQIAELLTPSSEDRKLGLGDRVLKSLLLLVQYAVTSMIKGERSEITESIITIAGDILLYQTKGELIRQFIQQTIEKAEPPVVLLTHSLGGVASVDLLVKQHLTKVALLVTVGSQAPYLYEKNCLYSLQHGEQLPNHFPQWLNIYDSRDFLSYVGAAVFPNQVEDVEVNNKQPFPQSHNSYWENQQTWDAITLRLP
jgi:hypothetical protein